LSYLEKVERVKNLTNKKNWDAFDWNYDVADSIFDSLEMIVEVKA